MRGLLALPLALAFLLGGCKSTLKQDLGVMPAGAYAALYPYYVEVCAASEFKKRPGSIGPAIKGGGRGGHQVVYLNGVCRAGEAGNRTLALCAEGKTAPTDGVGISVNAHYKNAKWVATPGREFFFHGVLKPGEALTAEAYQRTITKAQTLGIYDGVAFHAETLENQPSDETTPDFTYMVSLGTDYALSYARDRYCARVPVSRAQMSEVVNYLNAINAPYAGGAQEFQWGVLSDNCAHLSRNALAKLGIWKGWATHKPYLSALFSFPVPKNEFVNLMRRTNDMPIGDIEALYDDPYAREALMKEGIIATQPGALAELERAVQENAVYDPDVSLIFYDDPTLGPYERRYQRILAEPRYWDLRANLDYFAGLYQHIQADRKPLEFYLEKRGGSQAERTDFAAFYARYYDYIAKESAAVAEARMRLGPAQ
jgi:hypothetical protein